MAQMGRKPVKDKKQRLEIWLRKSVINNEGGKEKLKRKIMNEYEAKYAIA